MRLFGTLRDHNLSQETTEQKEAVPCPEVNYVLDMIGVEVDGSDQDTTSDPGSSPNQPSSMSDSVPYPLALQEPSLDFSHGLIDQTLSYPSSYIEGLEPSIGVPSLQSPGLVNFCQDFLLDPQIAAWPVDAGARYEQHPRFDQAAFELENPLGDEFVDQQGGIWVDPTFPDDLWMASQENLG